MKQIERFCWLDGPAKPAEIVVRYRLDGQMLGDRYRVTFFAPQGFDPGRMRVQLDRVAQEIDRQLSLENRDFDLARLARRAEWPDVGPELALVIDEALEICRRSGGAALALADVVAGFGVDRLTRVLEVAGVGDYLVVLGPVRRAAGRRGNGRYWQIGAEQITGHGALVVSLKGCAIATSAGRSRRECSPVEDGVRNVCVMAPEGMQAQGWANALRDMGAARGIAFAKWHDMNVVFVLEGNDGLRTVGLGSFGPMVARCWAG